MWDTGSQDSKDGVATEDTKSLSMPEEMGKNKVASWLTNQGLKKVRIRVEHGALY